MVVEVHYKGWQIEPQSYQSADGRWHPKATVSVFKKGSLYTPPLGVAPRYVMFDTKELADAYSVKLAKKWIDDMADHDQIDQPRAPAAPRPPQPPALRLRVAFPAASFP